MQQPVLCSAGCFCGFLVGLIHRGLRVAELFLRLEALLVTADIPRIAAVWTQPPLVDSEREHQLEVTGPQVAFYGLLMDEEVRGEPVPVLGGFAG